MLFLLKWSIEKNYKYFVVNELLDDICIERGYDDFIVEKVNIIIFLNNIVYVYVFFYVLFLV